MNAARTATVPYVPSVDAARRVPMVGVLRALLLVEAAATLVLSVALSLIAAAFRDSMGGEAGRAAEETFRFAAAGAFGFAIVAVVASRGARRRRTWAWTLAAILQVVLAIGTGIVVMTAEWHPLFLIGFAGAIVVMVVLSTASVRRALGQE